MSSNIFSSLAVTCNLPPRYGSTRQLIQVSTHADFNTDIGEWLRKGMRQAFGKDPIQIRTAGGSIPISPFVITLDIPAVAVPTVNPDNNQHSPNENIRLGNYIDGIKTIAAILMEKL